MTVHYCMHCGGVMHFGIDHVCKPVSEDRIRQIVREELAIAMRFQSSLTDIDKIIDGHGDVVAEIPARKKQFKWRHRV